MSTPISVVEAKAYMNIIPEYDKLKKEADKLGMKVATFVRMKAMKGVK